MNTESGKDLLRAMLYIGPHLINDDREGIPRSEYLNRGATYVAQVMGITDRVSVASWAPSYAMAWAECGFPMIEPSHRLAASLMSTRVSDDVADSLEMPWRCFGVRIPDCLCDAQWLVCLRNQRGEFNVMIWGELLTVGTEPSLSGWANLRYLDGDRTDNAPAFSAEQLSASQRTNILVGRLLTGVVMEMGRVRPSTQAPGGATHRKRQPNSTPTFQSFRLTRNVVVDCRQAVREYSSGNGNSPLVQSLVRGHWKNQPCGQNAQQRKLIHVEPYWRGPEDAPVAVRSHVVTH